MENTSRTSLENSIETLKDNASSVKESVAFVKESVATLVDQGGATIDALKARVGDIGDKVKAEGAIVLDRTESLVQKNPFASVAIAFGLGYVAMRLRTSPLVKLGLIAGLGALGVRFARR